MVVIKGLAVTATVIVWTPPELEDEGLEHALAVATSSAAAAVAAGHPRRGRLMLVRLIPVFLLLLVRSSLGLCRVHRELLGRRLLAELRSGVVRGGRPLRSVRPVSVRLA
jgi:hypothetical protein